MVVTKAKRREEISETTKLASPSRSITKAKQSFKIAELRETLVSAGFDALDDQAAALGISRSTAWTILNSQHKSSGLSAATIRRILQSPQLPPGARRVLMDYIEQKCAGEFGTAS
jgi:hypothetical protein